VAGDHSNDCRGFLMILDNILTVCETAGGKRELAGLRLNQEASQKELDGVQKMARRQMLSRCSSGSKSAAKNINIAGSYTKKS
jgi:hypothetical protein